MLALTLAAAALLAAVGDMNEEMPNPLLVVVAADGRNSEDAAAVVCGDSSSAGAGAATPCGDGCCTGIAECVM